MIHLNFRSKRLLHLFTEVWVSLPTPQRAAFEQLSSLVTDAPRFLPIADEPILGTAQSITFNKSIYLIVLNRARLGPYPAATIKEMIGELLDTVLCESQQQPQCAQMPQRSATESQ